MLAWKLAMNVKTWKYVQKILDSARFDNGTADPKVCLPLDQVGIKAFWKSVKFCTRSLKVQIFRIYCIALGKQTSSEIQKESKETIMKISVILIKSC